MKEKLYRGFQTTNFSEDDELRIISKLLFSSGLNLDEIKSLKWEELTILENILLINYKKNTRTGIASNYVIEELLKLEHKNEFVFPKLNKLTTNHLKKLINNQLALARIHHNTSKVNCNWLEKNFINTLHIPKKSEVLFNKHIINKVPIIKTLNKKEFEKLLEVKSLI